MIISKGGKYWEAVMSFIRTLFLVLILLMGLIGFYLIFSTGYIDADPFNIVLYLVIGGIIVFFYIFKLRNKE